MKPVYMLSRVSDKSGQDQPWHVGVFRWSRLQQKRPSMTMNSDGYVEELKVDSEFDVLAAIGAQNEADRTPLG